MVPLIIAASSLLFLILLAWWIWSRYESAEPNQWLLRIRNGKPVQAGIGIRCWRRPGDAIARFTSTMQRVTFDTEVYTEDKQQIRVAGFILWAIGPEEDAPFRAFYKLGIAHRPENKQQNPEAHHALSRAQHHAFRRSVEAVLRKSSVRFPLRRVLSAPEDLALQIKEDLQQTIQSWGILLEATEITELDVIEAELFAHLQAPYLAQSRQEAEEVELASAQQIRQLQLEQQKEVALHEAQTQREQELKIAQIEQEKEQEKTRLYQEQLRLRQEQLEQEAALQRLQEDKKHEAALEATVREEAQQQREETMRYELQQLVEKRLDEEAEARLRRLQREQEAQLEQESRLLELEQKKSEEIRAAELSREVVQQASEAIQSLPLHDVRWLSCNDQGPASLLTGLIDSLQQLAQKRLQ